MLKTYGRCPLKISGRVWEARPEYHFFSARSGGRETHACYWRCHPFSRCCRIKYISLAHLHTMETCVYATTLTYLQAWDGYGYKDLKTHTVNTTLIWNKEMIKRIWCKTYLQSATNFPSEWWRCGSACTPKCQHQILSEETAIKRNR